MGLCSWGAVSRLAWLLPRIHWIFAPNRIHSTRWPCCPRFLRNEEDGASQVLSPIPMTWARASGPDPPSVGATFHTNLMPDP